MNTLYFIQTTENNSRIKAQFLVTASSPKEATNRVISDLNEGERDWEVSVIYPVCKTSDDVMEEI